MSITEDNRIIGYRVYEAINAHDIAALDGLFDPQVIRHAMGEVGIECAKRAMEKSFAMHPNQHFVVEDVLADGDRVALRVTIQGVPVAPGQPQPLIMEIFRIANGLVAEIWGAGTMRMPDTQA